MTDNPPYTQQQLDTLVRDLLDHSANLLISKGQEYSASDNDRLANFNEVAAFIGVEPEEYAMALLMKHAHSLKTAVGRKQYDWRWQRDDGTEALKSRFADLINYTMLLAAIIDAKQPKLAARRSR